MASSTPWLLLAVGCAALALSSAAWPFGSLNLFGRKCRSEEDFSGWSSCIWPRRHLGKFIDQVIDDAKNIGCKVPPPSMLRLAKRHLHANKEAIRSHPLYRLIPHRHCGACGRQAKCCQKARSFMSQSFESRLCDTGLEPCLVDPITDDIREELAELHPDIEAPEDVCDVSAWTRAELSKLKADAAYAFVRPLFCQILRTTEPSFSCKKAGDKCACCCKGFEYQEDGEGAGRCVEAEFEEDPECAD